MPAGGPTAHYYVKQFLRDSFTSMYGINTSTSKRRQRPAITRSPCTYRPCAACMMETYRFCSCRASKS